MNRDVLLKHFNSKDIKEFMYYSLKCRMYKCEKYIMDNRIFDLTYDDYFKYKDPILTKLIKDCYWLLDKIFKLDNFYIIKEYLIKADRSEFKRLALIHKLFIHAYFIEYSHKKGRLDLECKDYIEPSENYTE